MELSYGVPIVFVMPGELEQVEASHRKFCSSLDGGNSSSLKAVKEARKIYGESVQGLNAAICLKGEQIRSVASERQSGVDNPKPG